MKTVSYRTATGGFWTHVEAPLPFARCAPARPRVKNPIQAARLQGFMTTNLQLNANQSASAAIPSPMTPMQSFSADFRALIDRAARAGDLSEPIAVDFDEFSGSIMRNARKGAMVPIDGVLIREWSTSSRRESSHVRLGMRCYQIEGISFVLVTFNYSEDLPYPGNAFAVIDSKDYMRIYRLARQLQTLESDRVEPPILTDDQFRQLRENTVGFLERENLRRIRNLGGRARRGLLLTGPPGNGKTSACRWLKAECLRRGWEFQLVSADAYAQARQNRCADASVRALFELDTRGIVVFDDFDIALRDRNDAPDSDHQSVFLNSLDGVRPVEGVVHVFTTNCTLSRIDRAFRRPGRIDVVLTFAKPDAELRRRLITRWHTDILAAIDVDEAVGTTDDLSFAELDELRNLLILGYLEDSIWDWDQAQAQFEANRRELTGKRRVGFTAAIE